MEIATYLGKIYVVVVTLFLDVSFCRMSLVWFVVWYYNTGIQQHTASYLLLVTCTHISRLNNNNINIDNTSNMTERVDESTEDDATGSNDEINELLRRSTQYSNYDRLVNLPPYRNITILDLGNCSLAALPTQMPQVLPNINILFLSNNNFIEMPPIISEFTQLDMIAFKGNGMTSIHPDCWTPNTRLRWIILTNNCITAIPDTIGHCTKLQKFMLSGNQLTSIPSAITHCTELELVRLACNQLLEPPMELLQLPKLKWVALGSNPFLESIPPKQGITSRTDGSRKLFRDIDETSGTVLGQGASGITRAIELPTSIVFNNYENSNRKDDNDGNLQLMTVAIKSYHSDITSDGTPELERHIALLVSQIQQQMLMSDAIGTNIMAPTESPKTGFIHVYGQCETTGSLVMEYLHNYRTIADPPSFQTCTRDVYNNCTSATDNTKWSPSDAIRLINVLLYSLQLLHSNGISHGDFYGHNILVSYNNNSDADDRMYTTINVRLSDFGAAFIYDATTEYGKCIETIEMRAFRVLLEELVEYYYNDDEDDTVGDDSTSKKLLLSNLIDQCTAASRFIDLYIYWQQQQLKDIAKAINTDDIY